MKLINLAGEEEAAAAAFSDTKPKKVGYCRGQSLLITVYTLDYGDISGRAHLLAL